MLVPPMRFPSRLAIVALLLFCALFLNHTGRSQESRIPSNVTRPVAPKEGLHGAEKAGDALHTSTSQGEEPTIEEMPENMPGEIPGEIPKTPEEAHEETTEDRLDREDAATDSTPTEDSPVDGVIVIGKLDSEDTNWVGEKLPMWQHFIYVVDNQSAPLHTPMNKGREATPYLTYIIDHYHNLPRTLVFLHSHEEGYPGGWHTDTPAHSNVWSVEHLNINYVQQAGYVNLRCTHIPGCPDEIQPFRDPFDPSRSSENHMAEAWQALFGNSDVPHVVGAACCAQFAVSRDQVLKRPLDDYIRYRKWVLETPLEDDLSGRIIEYLWHVIFGRPPVDCPAQDQCFWDVYQWETHYDD